MTARLVLAACAAFALCFAASAEPNITPMQAIERAAEAAPNPVTGTFDMHVKSAGTQDGIIFLDSEADYRDQRNLAVDIAAPVAAALQAKFGAPPMEFFKGKHIVVKGGARRVTIHFNCDCKPSDKYYYQTHVELLDAGMIEVLP